MNPRLFQFVADKKLSTVDCQLPTERRGPISKSPIGNRQSPILRQLAISHPQSPIGNRQSAILLLLLTLPLSAADVAKVGDTAITAETVQQTIARQGYNIFDEASARKGLDDAVNFELLAAEARKLGLDKDAVLARRIKELLVQRLVADRIDNPLLSYRATPEEAEAYFQAHTNEFHRPSLARGMVVTILIKKSGEAEAKSKAAIAFRELKESMKPESVVRAYSDDPGEKVNGGLSNFFIEGEQSKRYPQAVADAMLSLKSRGDVAGPIAAPRALYLIKLVEHRDPQPMPYEQVKAEIQKRLLRERHEKLLAEFCESLKKDFPVTVDEAGLKAAFVKPHTQSGPPPGPGDVP